MKRSGGRAGWVILVLGILAGLAVIWVAWGGPVRRWVADWMTTESSVLADAAAAYRARDWQRAADLTRPMLKSTNRQPRGAASLCPGVGADGP